MWLSVSFLFIRLISLSFRLFNSLTFPGSSSDGQRWTIMASANSSRCLDRSSICRFWMFWVWLLPAGFVLRLQLRFVYFYYWKELKFSETIYEESAAILAFCAIGIVEVSNILGYRWLHWEMGTIERFWILSFISASLLLTWLWWLGYPTFHTLLS